MLYPKDIKLLERVQRRANKYILNDFTSDYRDRQVSFQLLPLMMIYELLDIMYFVKSLKIPNDCFNISNYLKFTTHSTRSSNIRLVHTRSSNNTSIDIQFILTVHLDYACALPSINLDLPNNLIGASLSEPHIYVIPVNFVCLSIGPYVYDTRMYKCYSNLRISSIIDCSFKQYVSQTVLYPNIQETLLDK